MVLPEDGHALGLDRIVELVVGDHDDVLPERVRPEEPLQRLHDLAVPTEVVGDGGARAGIAARWTTPPGARSSCSDPTQARVGSLHRRASRAATMHMDDKT
jgi:hypothetical protein